MLFGFIFEWEFQKARQKEDFWGSRQIRNYNLHRHISKFKLVFHIFFTYCSICLDLRLLCGLSLTGNFKCPNKRRIKAKVYKYKNYMGISVKLSKYSYL